MTTPKWTEERTDSLVDIVGAVSDVAISQAVVEDAATQLGTSTRSVSSKLRKMGYTVVPVGSSAPKFSPEQEDALEAFVTTNSGKLTYAEIAENFSNGEFSAKSIQGKILSMELFGHVKPTPPKESTKTYTDEEDAAFVDLVNKGATVEQLAEAFGKSTNSVRGKALSLLRAGQIKAVPKQAVSTAKEKEDILAPLGDVSVMTVAEIAEAINKTTRGVKTMLTKRRLKASDYDGAAKAEKAAKAE